jgi:mannosyl-3-phosphoglycerate phosphatase
MRNGLSQNFIVITDLDGTLLDQRTYSYEMSLPGLRRLQPKRIPVVLCSTKTSAEMLPLWRELELDAPFICESGGAIYFPDHYPRISSPAVKYENDFQVLELGAEIAGLRQALAESARDCGVGLRSFGEMKIEEIAELTGLSFGQALLASKRRYDEPFVVRSGDVEKLIAALSARRLTVTRGDRLYHLTGGHTKSDAVDRLLQLHRERFGDTVAIGLGNSANDWPMLSRVERPVLVKNPDGTWDSTVIARIPNIRRTKGIGPQGWREAIDELLNEVSG